MDPESLVRKFGNRKFCLPAFGEKDTGLVNSSKNYDDQIETLLNLREEPRINQKSQLTEAAWDEELKSVKIVKAVGKQWSFMGHKRLVYPEEALFLLESNQTILKHGTINMSVQKAYEMLISTSPECTPHKCTLNAYRVYSHLVKLGYKVVRHKRNLNSIPPEQKDKRQSVTKKRSDMSDSKQHDVQVTCHNQKQLNNITKINDKSSIFNSFPNCYGQLEIKLTVPPSRLLPLNATPSKTEYVFHVPQSRVVTKPVAEVSKVKRKRKSVGTKRKRVKKQKSYLRINPFAIKRKSDTECLAKDMEKKSKSDLTIGLDEGPLASLWKGKTKPLLQPKDAWNTKDIRSILNLTAVEVTEGSSKNQEGTLEIIYDLYSPKANYCKSNPPRPNYRIALADSMADRVPSKEEVISAVHHLNDSVPLLIALCTAGSVSFYCFSQVNLSTLTGIG